MHQELTDEQEQIRLQGLRILARIIARQALAHQNIYEDGAVTDRQAPPAGDPKRGG